MTVNNINFYFGALSQTADYQRLFGSMNAVSMMQNVFGKIAPPQLTRYCAVGGLSNGKLTIVAHNGAIAAKLKQIAPSLSLKFRAMGYEVTAIRIAVQANSSISGIRFPRAKRYVGRAGRESLEKLALELPQSPLKSSVESLLQKITPIEASKAPTGHNPE